MLDLNFRTCINYSIFQLRDRQGVRMTREVENMSKQTYSICYFFKRRFRIKEAEAPGDINDLFQNYSDNGLMDADHLHKFLKEVQGEKDLTRVEAEDVMEAFLRDRESRNNLDRRSLCINEFLHYLFSDPNSALPHSPKPKDMTAPLSNYFIYTGHNSYLTGNQISSNCSVKPIIDALRRGVRAIELDMWPNCTKTNVIIKHGGTATMPVKLVTCLRAIKEHAFVTSDYPLIVTLEDHLTPNLQSKVAHMVTEVFGDILLKVEDDETECFPPPESLKGRVILSTKPPNKYLKPKFPSGCIGMPAGNGSFKGHEVGLKSKKSAEDRNWGEEILDLAAELNQEDGEQLQDDDDEPQDDTQGLQPNAPPEYVSLIGIRAHRMQGGIKTWLRDCSQNAHRVSLDEDKLKNAVRTHSKDIVRFNQRNLMRVYPRGTRINSSNYNPLVGWLHGAQMVAFNMQGRGRYLWLMQGFFRANGGCGYVKKPDILMDDNPHDILTMSDSLPVKTTLKVKVYMSQGWNLDFKRTHFDFYSPPDFYVRIGIAGVPCDVGQGMQKTSTIKDSWIPEWNEEFEFRLSVPELALLRIEVHDEDDSQHKDDFGGQTCLPVWELRSGIRSVPLHDRKGDQYRSVRLLMRFDFVLS